MKDTKFTTNLSPPRFTPEVVKPSNFSDIMPKFREFHATTHIGDDGHPHAIIRLTCAQCRFSDYVSASSSGRGTNLEWVKKRFEPKGWDVGTTATYDLCPKCNKGWNNMKEKKQPKLKVVEPEVKKEETPHADPPRKMSREDRRVIFAKLQDVYLDEKRGYCEDWSDNRVAMELGCPRVWVAELREENFGPVSTNPQMEEWMASATLLIAEARPLLDDALALADDTKNWLKQLHSMTLSLEALNDRLVKLERTAESIRKMGAL